jgi:hypothetical protein
MFRQSEAQLQGVEPHYDWVLNAKRSLLKVKLADSLADFRKIVASVAAAQDGREASNSDGQKKS